MDSLPPSSPPEGSAAGPSPLDDEALADVHAVMETWPSCVVVVDAEGLVAFANHHALAAFDRTAEELVGTPSESLLVPAAADEAADQAEEPHGVRRDGSRFPVELTHSPMPTVHGTHVITTITDVSRTRADQQRLLDANRAHLTLARLNQVTLRARTPDELYVEACRIAVEEGGHLGAWVGRRGPGGSVETVASAGCLDDYIAQLNLTVDPSSPMGRGPTARALRDGLSYYSGDYASDEATGPWRELAAGHGIAASAALPLRCAGRVVAVMSLWSARTGVFDESMRGLLASLVENVSFTLDRFDAAARLERSLAQRDELLHRLLDAQERERSRIAGVVHDDSVQALAAVDLRLGLLARRVREQAPELSATVTELQASVGTVSGELRRLLAELEPAGEDVALVDLFREAAQQVFEHDSVRWSVTREAGTAGRHVTRDTLVQTIRIGREALIGVRDRGGASAVDVTVHPQQDGVLVSVVDNGTGTGRDTESPGGGEGDEDSALRLLRDRTQAAGGWCHVERGDAGTELRFWLPRASPGVEPTTPDE